MVPLAACGGDDQVATDGSDASFTAVYGASAEDATSPSLDAAYGGPHPELDAAYDAPTLNVDAAYGAPAPHDGGEDASDADDSGDAADAGDAD